MRTTFSDDGLPACLAMAAFVIVGALVNVIFMAIAFRMVGVARSYFIGGGFCHWFSQYSP